MNSQKLTILITITAFLGTVLLSGCVTRSHRDWGYKDFGSGNPQVVQHSPSFYLPLQNNGTVALPNNIATPKQPDTVYMFNPQQNSPYPMQQYAGNNRMTYENNSEDFNVTDIFYGIQTVGNVLFEGAAAAAIIHGISKPHHNRCCRRW